MSGGSLDYFYSQLSEHEKDLGDVEINELVHDMVHLFYVRERCLSGDTSFGEWIETRDTFKQKWFTEAGREDRITKYLDDLKKDILDSLGLDKDRCYLCKHWKLDVSDEDRRYGFCDVLEGRLFHRSDSCNRFDLM